MAKLVEKLNRIKWKNYLNYVSIAIVAVIFSLMTFTTGLPQSTLFLLEKITMNIILAVSLSLVVGFLGEDDVQGDVFKQVKKRRFRRADERHEREDEHGEGDADIVDIVLPFDVFEG